MSDIVTGSNLGPEFAIGTVNANEINVIVDGVSITNGGAAGLSAVAPTFAYSTVTNVLTITPPGGPAQNIDLTQSAAADIFVNGGSFNAATSTLTLTDNDGGTPDVTIDLSTLLGVSTDAGNLLGNGADGKPLFTKANLDAQTAICQDVFGNDLFRGVNI